MQICMLLLAKYCEGKQPITGVDLQAITQIRALRDAGHSVTVIARKKTLKSKYHEVIDGVQVYRVGPSGLYWLWISLILWQQRNSFEVVHILGQRITSLITILLCRLLHIPTVLKTPISRTLIPWFRFDKILSRKLENLIARQASAYLTISEDIAGQLAAEGFYPARIKRLPNGVDMARFFPIAEKDVLRKKLGLPVHKKLVLYSGRLVNRKGFDLVLAAWPQIYAACADTHLVVVGGGPPDSAAALQQLAAGTEQQVTYIGHVPDPAPYLAASDIYLFPSRREGLPNALLEAMSCGCACIAADIGGCVELMMPEKSGLLFPAGDAQAMASAAIRLLRDESLARKTGEGAHALIAAEYELHSVIDRLVALYRACKRASAQN